MNFQKIIKILKTIILDIIPKLPDEITNQVGDIWFVFDKDTIFYKSKMLIFASHEQATRTITFYLTAIKLHEFDQKRLKELVVHEYGHALEMTEKQIGKMMEELK